MLDSLQCFRQVKLINIKYIIITINFKKIIKKTSDKEVIHGKLIWEFDLLNHLNVTLGKKFQFSLVNVQLQFYSQNIH